MIFLFVCIMAPNLVFGLNDTNITTTAETFKFLSVNTTLEEKVVTELENQTITTQVPQNSTTTTTITERQTKSVSIRNRSKTGQFMKWLPQKNLKKSVIPLNKKKFETPEENKAKQNMTKVKKPRIKKNLPDMPLKTDLEELLNSIHKMIDFFLENKNNVDIGMFYGLFLLNVNLIKVFKAKRRVLPRAVSFSLRHLLEKNQDLVMFFKKMVDEDLDPDDEMAKTLSSLFSNEGVWMSRIQPFDGGHVNDTIELDFDMLQKRYSDWDTYLYRVRDYNQALPRPDQSDRCLSFLAKNDITNTPWKKKCKLPPSCRTPVERGSSFGYGLTHRLLFLQLAYYGHRCYVFANVKDKEMRENFCKGLYSEASYISLNEYVAIDLFVEQLCLCAMDGHYEFLRRSWLMGILGFQTLEGCFSDTIPEGETSPSAPLPDMWRVDRGQHQYILDGQCNIHTSSAAAAALGFGVKFILETFY